MAVSTRQLGLMLLCLCAITLTLAWVIERRQILSFRQELDAWGTGSAPASGGSRSFAGDATPGGLGGYTVDYPVPDGPLVADDETDEAGGLE